MAVRNWLDALDRRFNVDHGRWIYDEAPPRWPRIGTLLTAPAVFLAFDAFRITDTVHRVILGTVAIVLLVVIVVLTAAGIRWERAHRHRAPGR
jgi:hypothetical protein